MDNVNDVKGQCIVPTTQEHLNQNMNQLRMSDILPSASKMSARARLKCFIFITEHFENVHILFESLTELGSMRAWLFSGRYEHQS